MKTNRMLDIIILLLEGKELSAQELAEKFNVTEKTIYRDIDFIREAGIPIVGKRGVKGGFKVEDKDLLRDKKITLKEQHKLMKLLKNQDRIPEDQLDEIMDSIENLFKNDRINWIEPEFNDPKTNEIFLKAKDAIINQKLVSLETFKNNRELRKNNVQLHRLYIKEDGLYLRFYSIDNQNCTDIYFNKIRNINLLEESFDKNDNQKRNTIIYKEGHDKI